MPPSLVQAVRGLCLSDAHICRISSHYPAHRVHPFTRRSGHGHLPLLHSPVCLRLPFFSAHVPHCRGLFGFFCARHDPAFDNSNDASVRARACIYARIDTHTHTHTHARTHAHTHTHIHTHTHSLSYTLSCSVARVLACTCACIHGCIQPLVVQ